MSMCRVVSCVVGKGCLLWPVCLLHKTLLAFALLHFVLPGQSCLLFQVSLDFLLLHYNSLWLKGHLCVCVLVLEGVASLHSQLHLLWHQRLGHRFGLLWGWIVSLGNEPRSFCHFWGCTHLLHFRLSCWLCDYVFVSYTWTDVYMFHVYMKTCIHVYMM